MELTLIVIVFLYVLSIVSHFIKATYGRDLAFLVASILLIYEVFSDELIVGNLTQQTLAMAGFALLMVARFLIKASRGQVKPLRFFK